MPRRMSRNWFVLLAAVLLVYEGSKTIFQWKSGTPPAPWFGAVVSDAAWPMASFVHGVVECSIGVLLLYESRWAGALGLAYYGTLILNTFVSWDLWGAWMTEAMLRQDVNRNAIPRYAAKAPLFILAGQVFYALLTGAAWLVGARPFTMAVKASRISSSESR